ncbi:MAG: RNA polymerase sigma factor [Parabacteroides sp.]
MEQMQAIARGDYMSYNQLFRCYYQPLCQYVYTLLADKDDAEDVVQELFLKLWKDRGKILITESTSSYLYRMAKNMSLNFKRSKIAMESLNENPDLVSLTYEENSLETDEFRIALIDCMNRLPKRSKEVLMASRVQGLKQQEIADTFSISVKTIKNMLWISLRKLKECLDEKQV